MEMNEIMVMLELLADYWLLLLPLVLIQYGLMIAALVHILKHNTYRTGSRVIWLVVCLLVNIIGPVLYFTIGKGDE